MASGGGGISSAVQKSAFVKKFTLKKFFLTIQPYRGIIFLGHDCSY
jgi:hypothetical protein